MDARRELKDLMERTGCHQAGLARACGVERITVNRWLTDRGDALEVPTYALSFLRALDRVAPSKRDGLIPAPEKKDPKPA